MRSLLFAAAVIVTLATAGCKDKEKPAPVVTAPPPTECQKLLSRITLPDCKAPTVDVPTIETANFVAMSSMNNDPNMKEAHEKDCKTANASLDAFPACKK